MPLAASLGAIALAAFALVLLVRDARGEREAPPVLLAALLAGACVLEPVNLAALVVCGAYLFVARPQVVRRYAVTAFAIVGLVVLVSERRFQLPFLLQRVELEPSNAPYLPVVVCVFASFFARGSRPFERVARVAIAATSATLLFSAVSIHGGSFAVLPFAVFALVALFMGKVSRHKAIAAAAVVLALVVAGKSALARKPRVRTVSTERSTSSRIGLGDPSSDAFVVSGFSGPEGFFRWTAASRAELRLPVPRLPSRATHLVVAVQLTPYLAEGRRTAQRVSVTLAGHALTTWTVKRLEPSVYVARIDRALLSRDEVVLTFDLPDAVSPSTLGLGTDTRVLGVAVHSIELRAEGEP